MCLIRNRIVRWLPWTGALLIVCVSTGDALHQEEKKSFVAYSMKVAEQRVRHAVRTGQDFRKTLPDVYYLGGITRPWAVVLDPVSGDWILLGERDPSSATLTLDDWVVALRARFVHGAEDPGVSIDPIPCEACLRSGRQLGCFHGIRQQVRFFAGVEDSHFGQVCFDADWLLKRSLFRIEVLPLDRLRQVYELERSWWRKSIGSISRLTSRQWFYPIVNRVNVIGDLVVLERFRMGVLTEVMYAEVAGRIVSPNTFHYSPGEEWARAFSEVYDEAARMKPVLETLRGLTRLAGLAKGLTQTAAKPDVAYWISADPSNPTKTPVDVEVLEVVVDPETGHGWRGGVSLMALVARLRRGETTALTDLVRATRPSPSALAWSFETFAEEGVLAGVRISEGDAASQDLVQLLTHADLLVRQKHYSEAISLYGRAIQVLPDTGELHLLRGAAYARNGQYDRALAAFQEATKVSPQLAPAWNALAFFNVLRGLAADETATPEKLGVSRTIVQLSHALRLNPFDVNSRISLGLVYYSKGDYARAIEQYSQALTLQANDAPLYLYRALAFAGGGDYERAIADYTAGLALAPSDTLLYRYRGLAYYYGGYYGKARQDWERAGGSEHPQRSHPSLKELFATVERRLWK